MRRANLSSPDLVYDSTDPPGFKVGMDRFGPRFGAELTGASLYHLPPGEALCPYHYEYGEEEWMLVVEGTATVRTPEGTEEVGPLELVYFPTGPDGAHQILNEGDQPTRVLMWSNHEKVTATAYPDSDKVGIWTGDKAEDVMVRRSSNVDYYDGEGR
jgi:uncharacterized cupin superfamily protein